jgi:phosphoribosylglycinamide formyltransferase-1
MSLDLAVLISGNGSNLQAIIDAINHNEIDASIKIVISDRMDAKGLERAQKANIQTYFIEPAKYQSKEEFDDALSQVLIKHQVSLTVLAGFMRILSDKFVTQHLGSLINIHPSLLPKYKGLNTHQRVLDAGESEHGASVHFVTPKLDDGPIILQSSIPVLDSDNSDQLKQKIHKVEHIIYPKAIDWISTGRIELKNEQVYFDGVIMNEQNCYYKID